MPDAKQPAHFRIPPALIGVGVLVVALALGLPALMSPAPPPDAPPPAAPEAAEAFAPRPGPTPAPANIGVGLLRLVIALAVVCALLVLAVKWVGRKPPETAAAPSMRVVASLRVGRCAVHLVRAGDRRILIGTDVTGVKALVELAGSEPEPAPTTPEATPDTPTE